MTDKKSKLPGHCGELDARLARGRNLNSAASHGEQGVRPAGASCPSAAKKQALSSLGRTEQQDPGAWRTAGKKSNNAKNSEHELSGDGYTEPQTNAD